MATFQTPSQEQLNSDSFVNANPDESMGASVIPQANFPSQQPNIVNAGIKRKAPDDVPHNDIPHKQPATWQQQAQGDRELFCEICNVRSNSISQALQHKQGKVHLNKAKKMETFNTLLQNSTQHDVTTGVPFHPQGVPNPSQVTLSKEEPRQVSGANLECVICQKLFNSESQAEQHFQSPKHKHKLQQVSESNASPQQQEQDGTYSAEGAAENETLPSWFTNTETDQAGLYCEPCNLAVNSTIQMTTHLQGTKHKNAVANGKSLAQDVLRCKDCVITFNSHTQLEQHLTSPKHFNKVQKKQTAPVQFTGQGRGRAQGRGQTASMPFRGQGRGQARGRGQTTSVPFTGRGRGQTGSAQFRGQARGRGQTTSVPFTGRGRGQTGSAQFRGQGRGQARGLGRARGASRGGQSYRGRGTPKPPPLGSSFVKADGPSTSNHGYPYFSPAHSTSTPGFTVGGGASFQQHFV